MKRSIIYKVFGIAALAFAALSAISCTEKESEPAVEPVFPEMVTVNDVVPGTKLTLGFIPNLDWTLSIPEESFKWFKILDGKFEAMSISGNASNLRKNVTIWTTSDESFDLRSTKIYLTMGGQKQPVAEYFLQAKERVVEVYAANVLEDGFERLDDDYVYSTTQISDNEVVELQWDNFSRRYYFPIKVKSNYNWEVQWPEWARADITAASTVGELELEVYGVPSKLPLVPGTEGVIAFKNGENVIKSINVRIPSSWDIFEYNLSGYTSLSFDHAAYLHGDAGSYTKDPVMGYFYGPQASRAIVLDMVDGKYTETASPWVNLGVTGWDSVEGASVLQQRDLSITVSRYAGNEDRNALILILPATAPTQLSALLSSDMSQVNAEYADYAITVTQSARPAEYITFEETSVEAITEAGIIFERTSEPLPMQDLTFVTGCDDWMYDLSYVKEYAESKSSFFVTESFATADIYDAEGNKITENLSEHWLGYNQLGEGLYGHISMNKENLPKKEIVDENGEKTYETLTEVDGYVVFKDDFGHVLCSVHCFYVAEKKSTVDILEDAADVLFKDKAAAELAGATAHKIVAGPTYEAFQELQAPIYLLTYKVDDTTLDINTSKKAYMYVPMYVDNKGKTHVMPLGPEMVTVDNQIYHDKEYENLVDEFNEKYPNATTQQIVDFYPKNEDYDRSTAGLLIFGSSALEPTRIYPGYSSINMTFPAEAPDSYKEIMQFTDMSGNTLMLIICVLDI